jgi:protein SCO1/2
MSNATSKLVPALVAIALLAGAWIFIRAYTGPRPQPQSATVLPSPMELPDFSMLDQDARPFTRASLEDSWNLLFFGFTNCPDVCPATLQRLTAARSRLLATGLAESELPGIILISVDPERDSPEILKSYVANFGENIVGLAGNASELEKLTKRLGIFHAKSAGPHGGYNVDHSSAVLLINTDAQFHALFSPPYTVDDLVHDLPLILASD